MACEHKNAEWVPSYYDDTRWCPECGAVQGTSGVFGPGNEMLPWKQPRLTVELAEAKATIVRLRGSVVCNDAAFVAFHEHLDACAQCRDHPLALCERGARLLEQAGLNAR